MNVRGRGYICNTSGYIQNKKYHGQTKEKPCSKGQWYPSIHPSIFWQVNDHLQCPLSVRLFATFECLTGSSMWFSKPFSFSLRFPVSQLLHQLGPPSLKSFTGEFSGSPHLPAHLPKPLSQNKKRPMLRQTKQAVSLLSFDLKHNHLKHFYTLACGLTCMGLPLVSLSGYCTCELNCPLGSHWLTSQSAFACCCKWLHLQLVLL